MDKNMQAKIVGKASADAGFRARLLGDPKGAIAQLGITIPASLSVEVHEESATTAHLVLAAAGGLTESELEAVAGGTEDVYEGKPLDRPDWPSIDPGPVTGGQP